MSEAKRENIKSLIDLRKKLAKANFLVLGKENSSFVIIRNLFDRNFNEDDLKTEGAEIKNLNIEKDISISYSKVISEEIDYKNYDYILCGISLLSKRLDFEILERIQKIKDKNINVILILTEIEKLDLREFTEMIECINNSIEGIDIVSVMDNNIESKYSQWNDLVEIIEGNLEEKYKMSFMKSQILDNSFKNNIFDKIVDFYVNIFEKIEDDTLSEEDVLYIQENMIDEILVLYQHNEEVSKAIRVLVEENIKKLIDIKRDKIIAVLKAEEEERLRKEAEEMRLKEEREAKIRAEEEEKRIEEERLRKEEEEKIAREKKLKEEEEERLRREQETARLEEERLKKEEEEKIKIEEEAKRKAEEKEKQRKAEKELKERDERLKQERLDLIELKKLEEERKILNEKIRELNKKLKKTSTSNSDVSINDMIIEASFTVDDSEGVEPKNTVNEIEARIDAIIYEAIATRMEELAKEVREEIKEKLRDNSII